MITPKKLQCGSTVAAISLSWGGPAVFPYRYEVGKRQFEQEFGVTVIETTHALKSPEWLHCHPEARAEDLMAAFDDPGIDGIIATIGGEDSIRILPFLNLQIIREHPKVFMGYSDTTVTHFACYKASLVSFYGPAFMAGFAENGGMFPYLVRSVRKTLFSAQPIGVIEPNSEGWTVEFLDWADPQNQTHKRTLNRSAGWTYLQGEGRVEGHLLGGCLEVLDWLRGTPYWPALESWQNAILFIETSEEGVPPSAVVRFLRSLAAMGVLERLAGILFGRPGGQIPPETFVHYDEAILTTVRDEYGLTAFPIVTNMDFGHTDPMFVLPLGVRARIDCEQRQLVLLENAVSSDAT